MRAVSTILIVALSSTSAVAQPGQVPPVDSPPPPQPYPPQPYPPQPYPPPAYPYAPPPQPVVLTPEEHELLEEGEISSGQHVGGVVLNLAFGFGLGQAVQGRWGDTGWIFTLGHVGSAALFMTGIARAFDDCPLFNTGGCDDDGAGWMIVTGVIGFTVFYAWGAIDAVTGPMAHNRKVRSLRARLGQPAYGLQLRPYAAPTRDGGVAGLTLSF
ncbi:MAG: hypothetical protein AB7P03_12725 [Kofleriaceae bacterium]